MGALISLPRKLKLLQQAPTLPLPVLYNKMLYSTIYTGIIGIVYIGLGISKIAGGDLASGIVMIVASISAAFSVVSKLYNKYARTVNSMYLAACTSVFFGLLVVAVTITEIIGGVQDSAQLVILIILCVGMFINVGIIVFLAAIVIKRLKAGEDPRNEANRGAAITGTVNVLQTPVMINNP